MESRGLCWVVPSVTLYQCFNYQVQRPWRDSVLDNVKRRFTWDLYDMDAGYVKYLLCFPYLLHLRKIEVFKTIKGKILPQCPLRMIESKFLGILRKMLVERLGILSFWLPKFLVVIFFDVHNEFSSLSDIQFLGWNNFLLLKGSF